MNLTRTAIARPVFILMIMLASALMGLLSYMSMQKELNPDVTFPTVTVTTSYPGAGPDDVSTQISKKLEDAISGTANLREVTSTSREGISTVVANFNLGTNIDSAMSDVRSRVDSVSDLPTAALRPTVLKFDNSSQPVLDLSFTSTARDSQQLRDLLDNTLKDRFAQIPGVAEADIQGGDVREIHIQPDKARLLAYHIGIADLAQQIDAASSNIPGGRIVSGDKEFSVRVPMEWKSINDIRNTILTVTDPSDPNASPVRVKLTDVAKVSDSVEDRTDYSRLDGKDTIVLAIQNARDGNAIEITRQADALIKQIAKDYPDIKVTKTFESAKQISDSLNDLFFTLAFSVFLVALVVYVFLHNFRGTLIVAVAIPVCICAALCAASLAGFTINSMTMLALILAVAVLVDDAIVVLENIYRHLKMGEDPRDAAIHGRTEIGLAAIAITMADVVVFLPIAFMGGIVGEFFKPLAWCYVFAVLASMFVSFTVTPMLAARWYRAGEDMEHPTDAFARLFERGFGKLERAYGRILEWSLNHRWFVFILGNSALFAAFVFIFGGFTGLGGKPMDGSKAGMPLMMIAIVLGVVVFLVQLAKRRFRPQLLLYGVLFGLLFPVAGIVGGFFGAWKKEAPFKFEFIPATDNAQVNVAIKMPPDSSLARTERVVEQIEKVVSANPSVKYVLSNVGSQSVGGFSSGAGNAGSNYAQVQATLYDRGALLDKLPWKKSEEKLRWISDTQVAADLLQAIGRIPGAELKVSANSGGFGSPIQMSFVSENHDALVKASDEIKRRLQAGAIPGVINVDLSTTLGKAEIHAVADRQMLAENNITVASFGATMDILYNGDDTARFRVNSNEYKVRVQLSEKDRNNPDLVNAMPITFRQGTPILVSAVSKLEPALGVDKISRRDRSEEIQLTADLLPGFAAGTVQQQITSWIAKEHLTPADVAILPLGQADAQAREGGFIMLAFALGIVLVYMLLASLYDNLLYPFIIQMAQPQAITGAILGLVFTNMSFNLIGIIGIITLTGLVGKNAILLVDYTNTLRSRGRNRHDALVEAGPTRLRPIAMTTVALIVGTLPIALAIGRGSEFRQSIGVVIIGGMTVSTMLTLVLIPCSYTIFDDMSEAIGRLFRGGSARGNDLGRRTDPPLPVDYETPYQVER